MRLRPIFCLVALLLLSACAKQPSLPAGEVADPRLAASVWEKYLALPESASPYRINMSLRYGPQNDTRRVTAVLWSNGTGPVRLDVMAGMGPLVARLREDGPDFTAVSPRENRAWVYTNADPYNSSPRVLINFGLPLPFSLSHVADLLQGNFSRVFGAQEGLAPTLAADGIRYGLTGQFAGSLELSPAGLPLRWTDTHGWTMELAYDEQFPTMPDKITLHHTEGHNAILLVKNRERPEQPYTAGQLALEIPAGLEIRDIRTKQ